MDCHSNNLQNIVSLNCEGNNIKLTRIMYAKEITDMLGEIFEVTPENRFKIAKYLSCWPIDFKILTNGNWLIWSTTELFKTDGPPTIHFYNGKFWNKPQKTPDEIGKCLKDTNTTKLHERIVQLEKQLLETKLENESLGRRLIKAYLEIDRLTTI